MVCLQSTATGSRICLAAEGFGNRHCYLENIADKNCPPHMTSCVFVIEQALSVRALQEMITAEALASQSDQEESSSSKGSGGGGSKTLLYGHAVLLRHGHSKMYLACLSSTGSSSDKLAFDVGLQEHSKGEACWWTVHPASKQRSEGEKVRVGDEIILVSVATERYLVSFVQFINFQPSSPPIYSSFATLMTRKRTKTFVTRFYTIFLNLSPKLKMC